MNEPPDPANPLWIEVVTDTFVPDINGVAISLGRLCNGLRALGHRVEVIRSGKPMGPHEVPLWWWPLPGYWEVKMGAPLPGQLRRRWERNRPDIVYVAIETPLGHSALKAAQSLGIPVIGGFHTNFHEYAANYGVGWVAEKVWDIQKRFHERLACTLVPSPDALGKLSARGLSNLRVLGRGIDTELFNPAKRSEAMRARFGAKDGEPLALVVGRISSEKNIGLAIRAFERMRARCPELVCVVVGDGPVRAKLAREHPQVRFPGYLTGEELAACYASADIFLFPSQTETFGNVLLEALASGLAVLGYDYAAAGWHGLDGANLLKVTKGDEVAFLAASEKLLDPALRANLAAGGLATARGLGWPAIVAQFEGILRDVAGG